jgi:hypothetical protein
MSAKQKGLLEDTNVLQVEEKYLGDDQFQTKI